MRTLLFACASLFLLLGASGCPLKQSSDTPPIQDKSDNLIDVIPKKEEGEEDEEEASFVSYEECVKNGGDIEGKFPARKCTLNSFVFFENDSEKVFSQKHLACESDADCVPLPECHPHSCVNADFVDEYGEQPEMCIMLFDGSAAYSPEDCLCTEGYCANKNVSENDLALPPLSDDCSDEENLVCGATAYCECTNGQAVSVTPIDVDKPCMRSCEKVIEQQTYLNECIMKEAGATLVAKMECLQMDDISNEVDPIGIPNPSSDSKVSSFEDCVAAGNPVMESYPRQCNTPGGELFVEEIEE